ncbi:hypothetical protein 1 [Hubei orthoptera virus 3]|uniref:hypothetical protein 1 n=1 Tax=Hubei orthoptera virus 3 TaxID=1923011 RepID=UPI00090A4272|nr:hypothetical protein 1 [Hubei orthoptera virus 3]APG78617.1 hypothetical protein 1 [Hubei orthoptera virus 3]
MAFSGLAHIVEPLRTIFKTINYPILNNIKIVNLIASTIVALLAARKTNLVLGHVFVIVALNIINFIILLFEILDVGTDEERVELTDTLLEVCKYRSPKDKLFDATSKEEAIKIYKEEGLDSSFLLPNCTYQELDKQLQKRHFHRWIMDVYPDNFLAMWWSVPLHDVEYMRRLLSMGSFKGAILDSDSEKQTINESYLKLFYDVVGRVLGVLSMYITAKLNGDRFTATSLSHGVNLGKDFVVLAKEFTDQITHQLTGNDPKQKLLEMIEKHSQKLNKFLETPAHYYASHLDQLYKIRDFLLEVEQFIRTIPRDFQILAGSLTALHGAACVRKNEIFSSELPNFSRQEPFVVLFRGPGNIGKTHFARHLARKFVTEEFPDGDMAKHYIEITPQDKYWPPLSGQRVALFDEAGTVQDYHNDLLMANLKSICSPAYFNCAAADVVHKISPCTFQLVFATSNTSINDIAGRIAAVSSAESVYSYFRRIMVVETEYDGHFDFNGKNRYENDYTHLKLRMYDWDQSQKKPRCQSMAIRPDQLYEKIKSRFSKMASEFQVQLQLATQVKQGNAPKAHFSVNLNGPGGVGKTPNANEIIDKLQNSLGYPVDKLKKVIDVENYPVQTQRKIILCDDLVTNSNDTRLELALMDLYNNKLANNSIIIFCTNREYKFMKLPSFTPFGVEFLKVHTFENIGLTRRLGYTGNYQDGPLPGYNREFHFRRGAAYSEVNKIVEYKSLRFIFAILFMLLPIFSFKLAFTPLISLIMLWITSYKRSIPYYQLAETVFEGYQDFLNYRKEINISTADPPNFEPNFQFWAKSAEAVRVTDSVMALEKHLFVDRNSFDNSNVDWKFLIDRKIAISLQNNFQKFFTNVEGVTRQNVIEVLKKYVRTFIELGIDIKISVDICGMGSFKYYNNVIYLNYANETQENLIAILTDDKIKIGPKEIPLSMDLFSENLASIYKLNLLEALALRRLLSSDHFLGSSKVRSMIKSAHMLNLQSQFVTNAKLLKDKIATFYATPLGKLVACISFLAACYPLISFIASKFQEKEGKGRKVGTRKIKPNPKYVSDEDQKGRVGSKKIRVNPKYRSDDERELRDDVQKEDVLDLVDMNSFKAYQPHLEQANTKARHNLCQLYVVNSKEPMIQKEPKGKQICYGLFIGGKTLVTVGHACDDVDGKYNLYAGSDEFEGFHICKLVSRIKMREISIWKVDGIPKQFPNLTKQFMKKKTLIANDAINVAIERLAPGKVSQWFQGEMIYWDAPYTFFGNELLTEFGRADFATMGVKVTSFGDCGLPYYAIDPAIVTNVILGIHFAGNVEGYATSGSCAIIWREEAELWLKAADAMDKQQQDSIPCVFCDFEQPTVQPASKPTCEGHEIAWSDVHESSPAQFYAEARAYFKFRPNFEGVIIKNSGPIGFGSVEHSHTQFLPFQKLDLHTSNGWQPATAEELGISGIRIPAQTSCVHRIIDVKFQALFTCLNSSKLTQNFRVYAEVYVDAKNNRRALIQVILISPQATVMELNQESEKQALSPLALPSAVEVYVNEDIKGVFDNANTLYKRNILPDVPFEKVPDNQTVRIIGTLPQNASRVPNPAYKKTPFSDAVKGIIPVEKAPVEYNPDRIPEEERKNMPTDRFGNPDARIGQSIQWAHNIVMPDDKFREYCRNQFVSKVYQYYSNLRLMSDREIFQGYEYGHRYYGGCSPLELDKSIGFTMKQLYHVQHKSDVIGRDASGYTYWHDNEAAIFAKHFFVDSKNIIENGGNHYSAYLELLKMEKLKLAKIYTGRTFCAQDLNGVLIERWIMGNFSAKAIKDDPTCGVGTNAYNDFHNIYLDLNKFKNMFTGDYKRFDRTCPWAVFDDIRQMLITVNPHLKNHINSVFNSSFLKRIQVSGTAVVEVTGGMPSGCTITAPLNCLNNDYMIYSAFVRLANAAGFNTSYLTYDRNVVRKFYGDDVIVSCSDEVAKFFNMTTVSDALMALFGMTLDSSAKDGTRKEFETYDEASWISRFFRKLDRYPFYVGALKKISIGAHFHYTTSLDPAHLGALFTTAQFEAALWEQDYFNRVQDAIRIAIKKMPSISKHFQFRSRWDIQMELFQSAQLNYVRKQKDERGDASPNILSVEKRDPKTFFESYRFDRQYRKHIVALCDKVDFNPLSKTVVVENHKFHSSMSFASKLNEAFQAGEISKPFVQFQILNFVWTCEISFIKDTEHHRFTHFGKSKAEAREGASLLALQAIGHPIPAARTVTQIQ